MAKHLYVFKPASYPTKCSVVLRKQELKIPKDQKMFILVGTQGSSGLLMYLPCGLLPYGQIMGYMVGATKSHYLGAEARS